MDVWGDRVARELQKGGGGDIWNMLTYGNGTGDGFGRCVPNVLPVVLALNESTARSGAW